MAKQLNPGRTEGAQGDESRGGKSNVRGAAHQGTSRSARHLNDDIDLGNARDEDNERQEEQDLGEHGGQGEHFGEVRQGDASGFGHPLSFQGEGFFGGGPPYQKTPPHIGMGNAVGYGPGRPASRARSGGGFCGKGPKGYQRSDERLTEDISDRLTYDDDIDASEVSVTVDGGEATLSGMVNTRIEKRRAEDLADEVPGITHVQNNLRVKQVAK